MAAACRGGSGDINAMRPSPSRRPYLPGLRQNEQGGFFVYVHTHEAIGTPQYCTRARRLTPEQEASIQVLTETWSLRSLAAVFGVSHEIVRALLRERTAVCNTSHRA